MSARGPVTRGVTVIGVAAAMLSACGGGARPTTAPAATPATAPAAARATASVPATSSATTTDTTRRAASRPRGPAHPVVSPLGTPSHAWRPIVSVRGRTAAWVAQRDGVTMLRFDQHVTRLVLHAGSVDPGPGPWRYGDAIRGPELGRLVAAFNAGFKLDTGAGGWRSGGRTAVPLVAGRASIVTYRDGFTDIGAWGQGVPGGRPVASVRQNMYLLVDHGVAASNVSSCIETCWGATIGGAPSVARSALGIDASGRLIYGAMASSTPATLAQGLIDGGVRRAAELDINPDWVAAYLYRHRRRGPPGFVPAIPGQYGVYGHFLLPYSRDFFAVLGR
jgi:hypothetical protein